MLQRLMGPIALVVAALALALAACTATGSATTSSATTVPTTGTQGGALSGGGGSVASGTAGGGGAGAGSTVTDPCTLLTQAEVSAAVGKQVGPGSSVDNPNSCDFQYPADGVPDIQAGIDFIDGSLDDYCNDAGASAVGLSIEPISGIGDGACFIHAGSLQAGSTLTFAKDGRLFQTFALLGAGSPTDAIKAADTVLAHDVLNHL